MATSAAWLSVLVKQGDFRIHNDILSFFFFFFCLPPGSKFGTGLSVKHEINLVWPNDNPPLLTNNTLSDDSDDNSSDSDTDF